MSSSKILFLLILSVSASSFGDSMSYDEAKQVWEENRFKESYKDYVNKFIQYNNRLRLDEKRSCYGLGKDKVQLFLSVEYEKDKKSIVINKVFADIDNDKSRCFIDSYRGLTVSMPPFFPFVFQMQFRN